MFSVAIVLAFFNALSVNAWCSYGGSQTTVGECNDGSVSVYETLTYSDNDYCAQSTGSVVACFEEVTSDVDPTFTPTGPTSVVTPLVTETFTHEHEIYTDTHTSTVTDAPIDIISSAVGLSSVFALISLLMF